MLVHCSSVCLWRCSHFAIHFGSTHLLKQHVKKKLFNKKKKVWNTALVHLPQSPGKMLLSKITIVHIVLLCDQSIHATKTLWKDDRCPQYWGFHFFNNWNFLPSAICCFIKTTFILPVELDEAHTSILLCFSTMKILLAKLHWSLQEGNASSVWFPNTFKDKKD